MTLDRVPSRDEPGNKKLRDTVVNENAGRMPVIRR